MPAETRHPRLRPAQHRQARMAARSLCPRVVRVAATALRWQPPTAPASRASGASAGPDPDGHTATMPASQPLGVGNLYTGLEPTSRLPPDRDRPSPVSGCGCGCDQGGIASVCRRRVLCASHSAGVATCRVPGRCGALPLAPRAAWPRPCKPAEASPRPGMA
jgi:hypothetical protein